MLQPESIEVDESAELVVVVDDQDVPLGVCEKLAVHRTGTLHRAVSVFLFADDGGVLLQRRADSKYHSAGLWSNAACTHPRPDETPEAAAHRCLRTELGVVAELTKAFSFIYRAAVGKGLVEHELDHVFVGRFGGAPHAAPDEVADWRYESPAALSAALAASPERFTPWLPIAWRMLAAHPLVAYR